MKKSLLILMLTFLHAALMAQSNDANLNTRLAEYMQVNRSLGFEKLMDYVHPSLFLITPREQLVQGLQQGFENETLSMSLDSIAVKTVSTPFVFKGVNFRKVDYYMECSMMFKDTALLKDPEFQDRMIGGLKAGFPGAAVAYNASKKAFEVKTNNVMVALKDTDAAPWYFLGVEQHNEELVSMLFPQEVIKHFGLL